MVEKTEEQLIKLQKYYTSIETQERIPLATDGSLYPGGLRKWLYSKFHRLNIISGILDPTGNLRTKWLIGLYRLFEEGDIDWGGFPQQLRDFYLSNNSTDASLTNTASSVAVASAAAHTLTCPAGHAYKIKYASIRNSTRGVQYQHTITPNGGTASIFSMLNGGVATISMCGLGAGGLAGANGSATCGDIWMQAGDTLTLTDVAFVVADVMRHDIIYEDYTL